MGFMPPFAFIALVLILARAITELWLNRLNQHHVRAHVKSSPSKLIEYHFRRRTKSILFGAHFAHKGLPFFLAMALSRSSFAARAW